MAVPGLGTAPLNNPDHRAEHERINSSYYKSPRGIVTYVLGGGAGIPIGNSPTVIYTLSNIPLQAGRLYLMAFGVRAIQIGPYQAGYPPTAYFSTSPMRPTGTTLVTDAFNYTIFGAAYKNMSWEQPFIAKFDLTLPLLQITVTAPTSSNIWTDWSGHMRIEDIGPDVQRIW